MADDETIFDMLARRQSELEGRCLAISEVLSHAEYELRQIAFMLDATNEAALAQPPAANKDKITLHSSDTCVEVPKTSPTLESNDPQGSITEHQNAIFARITNISPSLRKEYIFDALRAHKYMSFKDIVIDINRRLHCKADPNALGVLLTRLKIDGLVDYDTNLSVWSLPLDSQGSAQAMDNVNNMCDLRAIA